MGAFDDLVPGQGGEQSGGTFADLVPQRPTQPADFSGIQPETYVDKAALAADKIMRFIGSAVPSYIPSRQDFVDMAGGMAGMGGLLEDAPRIQNTTTDSGWKTLGKVLDPTALAVGGKAFQLAKEAPAIARMTSPILQNMIAGGAAGGAVGSLNGEPLEGAAFGALVPGAVSAAGKVVAPVARRVGEMVDAAVVPGGATRAAGRVATDVAKDDAARIVQALQNGVSVETAAQAAAPVGRAEFAGLERTVGNRDPSAFGRTGTIAQARNEFGQQAWKDLSAITGPERDAVLMAANMGQSGVPLRAEAILRQIDAAMQAPGFRSNPAVTSVLGKYRAALENLADPQTGIVNAHDLYTVRKTMGSMMESLADKEGWDKKLVRGLVKGMQNEIDFAIEKSSGMLGQTGNSKWSEYLNAFKSGAKKIEDFGDRAEMAKAQGVAGAAEARRISRIDEVPFTLPNLLSRPAMLVNALVRTMSGYGGERTTNELARLMKPEGKAELAQLIQRELERRGQRAQPSELQALVLAVQSANMGTRK